MNPKSLGIAGLMALSALALIAVIASRPFTSQAATHEPEEMHQLAEQPISDIKAATEITQTQQFDMLQGTGEEDDDSNPYIGIYIAELDDGSVRVMKVMTGGPSDGLLMQGDIITEVGGTTLEASSDLIDAVADAGVGNEISLTVTRDGSSLTIDITVENLETSKSSLGTFRSGRAHALPRFGFFHSERAKPTSNYESGGPVVHSRIVIENDDGSFSTHRSVIGTVSEVDSSAGTFTLIPKDGSDDIDFTISDDTKVVMNRNGDLGQLNTEDETLVVDVDGEVSMVVQGTWIGKRSHFSRAGKRFGIEDGGMWPGRSHRFHRNSFVDSVLDDMRKRFDNRS